MAETPKLRIEVHHRPEDAARVEKVRAGVRLIADGLYLGPVHERAHRYPSGDTITTFEAGDE